jgi:hypothetical protein
MGSYEHCANYAPNVILEMKGNGNYSAIPSTMIKQWSRSDL